MNKIDKHTQNSMRAVEIEKTLNRMLREAPNHGILKFSIHIRDGIAYRLETTRNESILLND
ncbi:MAG: hypothetical protein PHH86_08905 [Sphaerochaetaceae bacterium]|jgi:hypothetical protein|nr:hypothetical protein [Sphaerochaetaceae bacterium]